MFTKKSKFCRICSQNLVFFCEILRFSLNSDLRYVGDPKFPSRIFQLGGIKPGELDDEPTVDVVLEKVRRIVKGKYLIGHGIWQGDKAAMEYFIPPYQGLRDTAYLRRI